MLRCVPACTPRAHALDEGQLQRVFLRYGAAGMGVWAVALSAVREFLAVALVVFEDVGAHVGGWEEWG